VYWVDSIPPTPQTEGKTTVIGKFSPYTLLKNQKVKGHGWCITY